MKKLTRSNLPLGMGLALLLALVPSLACAGGPVEPGAPVAPQGDLVAKLPASANTIGFMDVRALQLSPLFEFMSDPTSGLGVEQLEEFIARTGIDPRKDIHQIAFANMGGITDPGEAGDASGLVVVATFDRATLEASMAEYPSHQYAGMNVYELGSWSREMGDDDSGEHGDEHDGQDDDEGEHADGGDSDGELHEGLAAILDDHTFAIGGADMLHAILDVAAGAASARTNPKLMGLQEDVDAGSEFWIVSAQDELFSGVAPPQGTMPQIPIDRIKALILSARFAEGVRLRFRGRTDAEADAKLLGDSLNGMLAFGKMMLQSSSPEIFGIIDRGLQAGSSGRDVTVRANLTMEDLETLRGFAIETMGDAEAEAIG